MLLTYVLIVEGTSGFQTVRKSTITLPASWEMTKNTGLVIKVSFTYSLKCMNSLFLFKDVARRGPYYIIDNGVDGLDPVHTDPGKW